MRIIAFTDVNMPTDELGRIPGIQPADPPIPGVDLTNFGTRGDVKYLLNDIARRSLRHCTIAAFPLS